MLAIFDGRMVRRPECLNMPQKNAVSALKDDFLVTHFKSIYPDSDVVSPDESCTFAYSLSADYITTAVCPEDEIPRYRYKFCQKDGIYCLYQGHIVDIDAVKQVSRITDFEDDSFLMIQAFQILKTVDHKFPLKPLKNISGNSLSVYYESQTKLVILAGGSYHDLPIYWGIDARFNLVISNNETVVEKACGIFQPFTSGRVYVCFQGQIGYESLFMIKEPKFKVSITDHDKRLRKAQTVESIRAMILQADSERSLPSVEEWEPPQPSIYKMNIDAVVFNDGKIGIGVIVRNWRGEIEFASTIKKRNTIPQVYPLTQAFLGGIHAALTYKLQRCVFESEHLNLEENKERLGAARWEGLLRKIAELAVERFTDFSVSFVSSSANKAAHRLALFAKDNGAKHWENTTPECIASIVESERPPKMKSECMIC